MNETEFWHCHLELKPDGKRTPSATANDLTRAELESQVIQPWVNGRSFSVAGLVVHSRSDVARIRLASTDKPAQVYADAYNERMRRGVVMDLATDRKIVAVLEGRDRTNELLFASQATMAQEILEREQVALWCRRLSRAASILEKRSSKRRSFKIRDEYDVQDFLQAIIRAGLEKSVQEDPIAKLAGSRSSRADISMEQLGLLIECKFARGPEDHKRFVEEITQDLSLYAKWSPLEEVFVVIYNSSVFRDPEALQELAGRKEFSGKKFNVRIFAI